MNASSFGMDRVITWDINLHGFSHGDFLKTTAEISWDRGIMGWYDSLLKMAIEVVDLPIDSMVDLSMVTWLFTRGYIYNVKPLLIEVLNP